MSTSIRMEEIQPPIAHQPQPHPRHHPFLLSKAKLGGIGLIRLMALIGGFCVSSVAELKGHETASPWLLTLFTVTTVLLTSMTSFVILFTACLLPYLVANEELDEVLLATGLIRRFPSHRLYFLGKGLEKLINITWVVASMGTVLLVLVDLTLILWIRMGRIQAESPPAGTSILSLTILVIVYLGLRFWRDLSGRKLFGGERLARDEETLEWLFIESIRASTGRDQVRKCSDVGLSSADRMQMSP